MDVNVGIVYHVNKEMVQAGARLIGHEGGTRSGKTYNTEHFLIDVARENPGYEITVASRTAEHLRKGAMKDFLEIMKARGLYYDQFWHATNHTYYFPNGAYIEFLQADEIGKVSGPGRDVLFCNEINFLKKPVFDQLLMRTRKYCIFDYNPVHPKHWLYDKILPRKDCFLWKSTYLDNLKFLPAEQLAEILMMRDTDPLRWQVYGLGLRASYQKGQIYGSKIIDGKRVGKDWKGISLSDYKAIDATEYFGLDWGFFPDPNAVVGVKIVGNKRYYRKIVYKNYQSDEELAQVLKEAGLTKKSVIVADHQKKSINVLRGLGFPLVYAAVKGHGSIEEGIKQVSSKECFYIMDPDFEFEYTNYTYLLDPQTEEPTGVPQDKHNHIMDAIRMVELYKKYL